MKTPLLARALSAVLSLSLAVGAVAYAPVPAAAAYPNFTINGAGYGHGIGLSQYGAKGFAEHGKTGAWIAAYYYPGTKIGAAASKSVNVNLDADANYRKDSSTYNGGYTRTSWQLRSGYAGGSVKINGTVYPDAYYTVSVVKSGSTVTGLKISGGSVNIGPVSAITVEPVGGTPPLLQVMGSSGPFDHSDVRYRGSLYFTVNTTGLTNNAGTTTKSAGYIKCINKVTMQQYLYGVVPRESPSSWHVEALKAQAIVARSYAWTSSGELYCTTWSQVYNGHSRGNDRTAPTMHEATSSNTAVDATDNQYVLYGSSVIKTFFHSTSGGHTANIEDVWTGTGEPSTSYPYRKGVEDPYCESPYDPWTDAATYTGMTLAAKLAPSITGEPSGAGTSVYVKSLALERAFPSNFVRYVDITWSNGAVTRDVSGDKFRSALGLRSTKFYINGQYKRIAYGNRFDTSAKVSESAFPTPGVATAAVVVNGSDEKFADALTASALAGAANGPVLLVERDTLPSSVSAELKRLGVSKAYVVGGEASVSKAVYDKVDAIVPTVERLAGSSRYGYDRYGTAASVAMKMKALGASGSSVLVASGEKWTDAAVAAAVGAGAKRPLLLASYSKLPSATALALDDLGATQSAVFGGPATLSNATVASVCKATGETTPTKRFGLTGGRYDIATEAAKWCVSSFGYSLASVYVATGERFPDTVTGGVLAGRNKRPLLLVPTAQPDAATATYVSANRATIGDVVVIGGPTSVSDNCASMLASYAY